MGLEPIVKLSPLVKVTASNFEFYLENVYVSLSSILGKGLVNETRRSASPNIDSRRIVRESRYKRDSELPGIIL
jgi:hypothetical protein